ncbi:hypothetical protein BC830DRAFT_429787 [Chytriomyces sp. MP71]|nr:hypothetical protein BC830DRAFT_429787 [Chytriomyces sp. MP71]
MIRVPLSPTLSQTSEAFPPSSTPMSLLLASTTLQSMQKATQVISSPVELYYPSLGLVGAWQAMTAVLGRSLELYDPDEPYGPPHFIIQFGRATQVQFMPNFKMSVTGAVLLQNVTISRGLAFRRSSENAFDEVVFRSTSPASQIWFRAIEAILLQPEKDVVAFTRSRSVRPRQCSLVRENLPPPSMARARSSTALARQSSQQFINTDPYPESYTPLLPRKDSGAFLSPLDSKSVGLLFYESDEELDDAKDNGPDIFKGIKKISRKFSFRRD